MAKKKSDAHGLRAAETQLRKRAQRASQISLPRKQADELSAVWEQASQHRALAAKLWFTGRDAALLLVRDGNRTEGTRALIHTLTSLNQHRLYQQYASCMRAASRSLTDEELLTAVQNSHPPLSLLRDLLSNIRQSLLPVARASLANTDSADDVVLVGMLLEIESTVEGSALEQPSLEAHALRYSRSHGAINVAGITFQGLYALWRVLRDETITEIALEDLEDMRFRRLRFDESPVVEHVQAKTQNHGWAVPDLQGQATEGNHVFDSFAEVAVTDPTAQFTFATDSGLTRGKAPALLSAVRKLAQIGISATLSSTEEEALAQLEARMRQELVSEITVRSLLARVTFDTQRSADVLRAETVVAISEALNLKGRDARVTYYALIGILHDAMAQRKIFSRTEIMALLEGAARRSAAFRGRVGLSGRVEVVDFEAESTSTRERFYQGLSSDPTDISKGWDIPRPDLTALINEAYAGKTGCLIRGVSGQGKTVLMYRYAYDCRGDVLVMRVLGGLDHGAAGDVIEAVNELQATTVLVLIDDVARGDRLAWPEALKRMLRHPRIKVLATSREDDWNLAEIYTLSGLVDEVNVRLDETTAEGIFVGLSEMPGNSVQVDDWYASYEQASGLLMEYIYLLTQGRRMVEVLREQIGGLRQRLGQGGEPVLEALGYISTAHAYGGYLTRKTLVGLLGLSSDRGLGDLLKVLEREFWIRDAPGGRYVGLHEVRSTLVMQIMHEHKSLDSSINELLTLAELGEVGALVESLVHRAESESNDE